ncbi:DUF4194 domain-containing protein [Microbacterium luticocti]|uniref:DUF4194 domain-containing protein n=1 Tax=Microbacterium luticocti TaxID=451764 RepID=UPI0003FD56CA|nr:DUF4194 domain-containing protein [Microbacterium luticocti]
MTILDREYEDDPEASGGAFDDEPRRGLPSPARRVLTDLLTSRFTVHNSRADDDWWATLIAYRTEIEERLADLYFDLHISDESRVAFKRRVDDEDAPKRLLRQEKPLSRDASFLLIFLRQECAYSDGNDGPVTVTRTELEEFLRAFRNEDDGNQVRFTNRVSTAIGQLVDLKLLQQDRDADYLFSISPALPALIGIEEITRLDALYRQGVDTAESGSSQRSELIEEPDRSSEGGSEGKGW